MDSAGKGGRQSLTLPDRFAANSDSVIDDLLPWAEGMRRAFVLNTEIIEWFILAPTMPSTVRLLAVWKAITAFFDALPNSPSAFHLGFAFGQGPLFYLCWLPNRGFLSCAY